MKKHTLVIILLLYLGIILSFQFRAKNILPPNENLRIYEFIKIWGTIKYFSEEVSYDTVDMDSVFF